MVTTIQEIEEERELAKTSRKATLIWCASFVTYFIIAIIFPLIDPTAPAGNQAPQWLPAAKAAMWYEIRITVGNGLITIFTVTILYDIITRTNHTKVFERALTNVIGGNSSILDALSADSKRMFVKNSVESVLGEDTGGALFSDLIKPLMDSGAGYRRNYKYEIEILANEDRPDMKSSPLRLKKAILDSKYNWVQESIEYQLFDPESDSDLKLNGPFSIVLTFDKDSLDTFIRRDDIFFRSLIELDEQDRDILFSLSDAEIREFVLGTMGLSCRNAHTGAILALEKFDIDRTSGKTPVVKILTGQFENESEKNYLRVDLVYPHYKSITHFTVLLPQPSNKPKIRFKVSREQKNLSKVLYFSNIPDERIKIDSLKTGNNLNGYYIEINDGWVFPTSGVTFAWEQV